jgi:glycosyltransferase involved in cell wall biosynthesis
MVAGRLWIVSELYYPEETSTGHFLTGIAEGLASRHPVRVLCGRPTYRSRGASVSAREVRRGVRISRCWGTRWSKDHLGGRLLNLVTLSLSMLLQAVREFRGGDRVLVVTNPPTAPFVIALACALKRARCYLLVHDVYPDALIAAGYLPPRSVPVLVLERLRLALFRRMERVVVLGRCMHELIVRKTRLAPSRFRIIPNWGDVDQVVPSPKNGNPLLNELGLAGRFVVQYSGNLGRTHGADAMLEAARRLAGSPDIHLLLIGSGSRWKDLEQTVRQEGLRNVTLIPPRPREDLVVSLNACDVALLAFVPGMSGISVPSRLYNILAAGKPILAAVDEDSEVARVIREERVGWVVPPDQPDRLAETLLWARSNPEIVAQMGARAREASMRYSRERILEAYAEMFGT